MQYEEKLNHPCKGLTGFDLSNSSGFDDIIIIRTIESKKEEILQDPAILFPVIDRKTLEYIYKEYCSTHLNLENVNMSYFKRAIDLLFLE